MIVDVLLSPSDLPLLKCCDNYVAIVIKVFKSGNTVLSALNLGCESVKIVHDLTEPPDPMQYVTIGGMPGGHEPHLPDSPAALNKANLRGRKPIVSSFPIHRAILAAERANDIFLLTFANVTPTVMYIRKHREDFKFIKIICCGADRVCYEDTAAAGCFIDLLLRQFKRTEVCLSDTSNICLSTFQDCAKDGRLLSQLTSRSTRMCVARFSEFYQDFMTSEDATPTVLTPNEKLDSDDIHNCIQKDMYYFPCKLGDSESIDDAEFIRCPEVGEEFHKLKKIQDLKVHESAFWLGAHKQSEVSEVFTTIRTKKPRFSLINMGVRSSTINDFGINKTRQNTLSNMSSFGDPKTPEEGSYASYSSSDFEKKKERNKNKKLSFTPNFGVPSPLQKNRDSSAEHELQMIEALENMMEEREEDVEVEEEIVLAEEDEEDESSESLSSDQSSTGEQGGAVLEKDNQIETIGALKRFQDDDETVTELESVEVSELTN